MRELFRMIEPPRRCGYLPAESASLEIRAVADLTASEYEELLARGWRRFGWQIFRPACRSCSACRSLRVPVGQFVPTASHRRILRKNADLRVELHPLFAAPEIVGLYNAYHRFMRDHRGWPLQQTTLAAYHDSFVSGPAQHGRQWLYFEGDELVAVAVMDETPGAISLVYCFHHPERRDRSLGTFSILNQILYAQRRGMEYAYFGYWIESCQSMEYKQKFRPHELLIDLPKEGHQPVWVSESARR